MFAKSGPGALIAFIFSFAATMIVYILSGLPVTEAPRMVIADMPTVITSDGISLA